MNSRNSSRTWTTDSIAGLLIVILGFAAPAAGAEVDKKSCKAHALAVSRLSRELGVTDSALGASGRSLAGQVQDWISDHDDEAVGRMQAEIEATLAGVTACESGGFFAQVSKSKEMARTLKSGALPWFRNAAALDPCQQTIPPAVKKRETDPGAAIDDLLEAIEGCRLDEWRVEGRRQLAAAYFTRGDLAREDLASGREQVRLVLESATGLDDAQRTLNTGLLARSTVEAGKALMESGEYRAAIAHWQAYIELFGTSGFEPIFASNEAASGAAGLRSLRSADYQWTLACLETSETGCVERRVSAWKPSAETTDAVESLATRALELARAGDGERSDRFTGLAFSLLDRWHRSDPDSYQLKRLLQESIVELEPAERLRRLRLTERCWIPTAVAAALREAGLGFVDEATLAASCEGGSGEAAAMLAAMEVDRARALLDRIVLTGDAAERATSETELDAMLASMPDTPDVRELREELADARKRRRVQVVNVAVDSSEVFTDCTTILATIQWNELREESTASEVRQFKMGCCAYLRKNRSGWVRHLVAKLGEDQVEAKQLLMDRYCGE